MALWPDADASTAAKGIVQLAGDLAGTASAPTVPGLSGKAAASHTHAESDVTNLTTDLGAKAASSHTHAEADVTSLVTDLTARAPKLTPTATKTSNYPSLAGDLVIADGTSGGFTVTAPTAVAGATFAVRKGDATSNRVILAAAGGDVFGIVSTSTTINLDIPGHTYTFTGVSGAWVPTNTGLPLTQLDLRYVGTGDYLTTGDEVFSRMFINAATCTYVTSSLRLSYFTARKTETTTQVRVISGSTAAAATPTLCQIALYSIDAAGAGTLVANTANDTTLFAAANTAYTRSWAASYAKVINQRYALGILVVSAAAAPNFTGFTYVNSVAAGNEFGSAPRLHAILASQTTLPSSFADASLANPTGPNGRHYGVVLP